MALSKAEIASLSRLLDEALALPEAKRDAWMEALPDTEQHLKQHLHDMLAKAASEDGDPSLLTLPGLDRDDSVPHPGDLVGPYRLLREIGRGGMGTVWLAARADGTYKREVALKLPRLAWAEGLAQRMARERDIGALLEHPNIARLYDAGVDEHGRPYLALEYVDGQSIEVWCRAKALSVPERLRLFVQVARAVAYAHGRLVVHRDLKPSNVLVTADGQAHLLDFGIAKLLQEGAPEETGLTQQTGRAMTPMYASPEQIAGEPVTVASDVYSLGVLLYELLTGALPLAPKRATLGAVEEAILEGGAPPASSRVENRATARALRGEVDAILGKAMKRNPAERYATADALAQDVERHLAGETVAAKPDSTLYRLRKTFWRNRVAFGATAAVLVAVLGGAGATIVQLRRANQEAERARVVKEFVTEVFRVNTEPGSDGEKARQLPAEQLLARGAHLIETRFPTQPAMRAELLGVVGGIYEQMGAFRLAADFSARQLAAMEELRPSLSEHVRVILRLSEALLNERETAAATKVANQALRLAEGKDELSYDALVMLLRCQVSAALIEQARQSLHRVQAIEKIVDVDSHIAHAWALGAEATLYAGDNKWELATATYDKAIATALRIEGSRSLSAAELRMQAASHLMSLNRWEQARAYYEPAIQLLRSTGQAGEIRALTWSEEINWIFGEFGQVSSVEAARVSTDNLATLRHTRLQFPLELLARFELDIASLDIFGGNLVAATDRLNRTETIARSSPNKSLTGFWVNTAAYDAHFSGQYEKADALHREGLNLRMSTGSGGAQFAIEDQIGIVDNYIMQGRLNEADAYLNSAQRLAPVNGDPITGDYYSHAFDEERAKLQLERGNAAGALRLLGDRADQVDKSDASIYPTRNPNVIRGILWCQLGQPVHGLSFLLPALALRTWYAFPQDPQLAWMRAHAGLCALQDGRHAEALQLAGLARDAFAKQPRVSSYYKKTLIKLEGALGLRLPPV